MLFHFSRSKERKKVVSAHHKECRVGEIDSIIRLLVHIQLEFENVEAMTTHWSELTTFYVHKEKNREKM
jgi:hypothetical protein